MSLDIASWETLNQRVARQEKERESGRERRKQRLMKKQSKQRRKSFRLLARMASELEISRKERESSPWLSEKHLPNGGVYYMGWSKTDRSTDTRRVRENDPGFRGWRTDELKFRKGRSLIGNRNGSEKTFGQPVAEKPLARNNFRQLAKRELQEELADIAEQERENSRILAKLNEEMRRDYQEYLEQECGKWEGNHNRWRN